MAQKIEMPLGEWFVRLLSKLLSKLIALASTIMTVVGLRSIVGPMQELINRGAYGNAACVVVLIIAVNLGAIPLAFEVEAQILGLMKLKPLRDRKKVEVAKKSADQRPNSTD